MDTATSSSDSAEPESNPATKPDPATQSDPAKPSDYSTPLLEALFTGRDRQYQATGSLIYGILGVAVFAIATSVMAGLCLAWADENQLFRKLHSVILASCVLVLAAMVYPTGVLVLQLFASCRLPVTVRVVLVYATLYACLRSLTFGIQLPADAASLLFSAPICLGGFIQHRFGGWNAVGWSQQARAPDKVTIASLLDLTAAIAITMGIASTIELDPRGLVCLLPTFLILAVLGMHPWARLVALSDDKHHRDTAFTTWMIGNSMWGSAVFLLTIMAASTSAAISLLAFVVPPLIIVIAHFYTALPLAWLRACGWKFVRAQSSTSGSSGNQTATFKSSI